MKKVLLLILILFTTFTSVYSENFIIYPSFDVINKTEVNSYVAPEELDVTLEGQFNRDGILTKDFGTFKQLRVKDYVTLHLLKFSGQYIEKLTAHVQLTFQSEREAEVSIFGNDVKKTRIKQEISLKENDEIKIDINEDGVYDMILMYASYDAVDNLPQIKVKGIYDDKVEIIRDSFCQLTSDERMYDCYKGNKYSGEVEETFQADALTKEVLLFDSKEDEGIQVEKTSTKVNETEVNNIEVQNEDEKNDSLTWVLWAVLIGVIVCLIGGYFLIRHLKKSDEVNI